MTKTYDDVTVIISIRNGDDGEYKKKIPVQGQSENGIDDPKFLEELLGQAMYKIQTAGAQTTLGDHGKPLSAEFVEPDEPVPACTCEFYAVRDGEDTCSADNVATPADCPADIRKERNCPFYDEAEPEGQPAALPPGTPEPEPASGVIGDEHS